MKRTISILLTLVLVLTCFSCARSNSDDEVAEIDKVEINQNNDVNDNTVPDVENQTQTPVTDTKPDSKPDIKPDSKPDNSEKEEDATPTPDTPKPEQKPEDEPEDKPDVTPVPEPDTDDEPTVDPYALEPEFEVYRSNTSVTTSNHYVLTSQTAKTETYRGVFPVQQYGRLEYCFYFSNNVDSTYAGGDVAYRNMPTESYEILSASIMVSKTLEPTSVARKTRITFDGKASKTVEPDEMFWSDPVTFNVAEGEYLVFEWKVKYTQIPCSMINYVGAGYLVEGTNTHVKQMHGIPLPSMIGAKRDTQLNISFIGDSITAGEGGGQFTGYVSQIAEQLGPTASVWNTAIGYSRANDAVNSPAWLKKAKGADNVCICLGVNDINSGVYQLGKRTTEQIVDDIAFVAKEMKDAGRNVVILSTPPYTYGDDARRQKWRDIVSQLKTLAKENNYSFFDMSDLLGDQNGIPLFGGHPNKEGCTVVANAFVKAYKEGRITLK